MATGPDVSRETPGTSAEHRVTLLQSEIKVRDQIANFKQRLDMAFVRLEQRALSDLRALTGQEMLVIREREDRILAQGGGTRLKNPAKVLAFHPNRIIERLGKELTELGSVKLENETDEKSSGTTDTDNSMTEDTDTLMSLPITRTKSAGDTSSQTTADSSVSRATSGFVHVGQNIGHSDRISTCSSFCFVESGTLSRRSKHRRSIQDKVDAYIHATGSNQGPTSPKRVKLDQSKLTTSDKKQKDAEVIFTVLKDNRIVTVSKSIGAITLYSPDFVVLSSYKTQVSKPVAICYHAAYDIIALAYRKDDDDIVELLKSRNNDLTEFGKLTIKCKGQVTCMAYSAGKLYLGCNGHHVHVFDEQWNETPILPHAQLGQKLISIAYNESVFCLVGSDGSVTYVDSLGRHLSKDSINALSVTYIRGTPFVLCRDKGINIVETSPLEEEAEAEKVVIKTGLSEVLDMHVSVDDEVAILFWNEGSLDIRKYKLYQ